MIYKTEALCLSLCTQQLHKEAVLPGCSGRTGSHRVQPAALGWAGYLTMCRSKCSAGWSCAALWHGWSQQDVHLTRSCRHRLLVQHLNSQWLTRYFWLLKLLSNLSHKSAGWSTFTWNVETRLLWRLSCAVKSQSLESFLLSVKDKVWKF